MKDTSNILRTITKKQTFPRCIIMTSLPAYQLPCSFSSWYFSFYFNASGRGLSAKNKKSRREGKEDRNFLKSVQCLRWCSRYLRTTWTLTSMMKSSGQDCPRLADMACRNINILTVWVNLILCSLLRRTEWKINRSPKELQMWQFYSKNGPSTNFKILTSI